MLSQTSDYALRAALMLGQAYGRHAIRADEIAEATGAPRNYMAKVLNALAKAGIVTSARGPSGGFALAIPPDDITIADVIDRFDEPHRHTQCMLGNVPCNPLRPCAAHTAWTGVVTACREPLLNVTLADLLSGRAPIATTPPASSPSATLTA